VKQSSRFDKLKAPSLSRGWIAAVRTACLAMTADLKTRPNCQGQGTIRPGGGDLSTMPEPPTNRKAQFPIAGGVWRAQLRHGFLP